MNVNGKYLKDETGKVISPITSVDTIFKNNTKLLDLIYPVGSYYETSNGSFDPNTSWGGTWKKDTPGLVTVALYNLLHPNPSGVGVPINLGQVVGESEHTLTISEIPSHYHGLTSWGVEAEYEEPAHNDKAFTNVFTYGSGVTSTSNGQYAITSTGGNQPHNNVQPSIGVYRWHRTA